jgi:hypothetical protein
MNDKDVIEQSLAMRVARVSLLHPAGMVALALWIIANLAVVILARGSLPFDRPAIASMPFATQVAAPTLGFLEIFALMGVVYAITRKRTPPDLAVRAPAKATAAFETFGVLVYAMLGQVGGWLLGPALGYRPFSFHIAGTLFGMSMSMPVSRPGGSGSVDHDGHDRRQCSLYGARAVSGNSPVHIRHRWPWTSRVRVALWTSRCQSVASSHTRRGPPIAGAGDSLRVGGTSGRPCGVVGSTRHQRQRPQERSRSVWSLQSWSA